MIWLFGDSIFRGYALGRFPEVYEPEEIKAEPLWSLRSPVSMINLVLGEEAAVLGGNTGLPDPRLVEHYGDVLRRKIAEGQIRPGQDQLVFLDVGNHAPEPDEHREQWLAVRRAATADQPIDAFICTGFDNLAGRKKKAKLIGGRPFSTFRHDESFNRAVIEAATAEADFKGRTQVIDIAVSLAQFEETAKGFGASGYLDDGIHLNIWGQLRLCASICRAVAPERKVRLASVRQLIKQSWPAAQAIAPVANRKAALELIDAAFAFGADAP